MKLNQIFFLNTLRPISGRHIAGNVSGKVFRQHNNMAYAQSTTAFI